MVKQCDKTVTHYVKIVKEYNAIMKKCIITVRKVKYYDKMYNSKRSQ